VELATAEGEIAWRWVEGGDAVVDHAGGDGVFRLAATGSEENTRPAIISMDKAGNVRWSHALAGGREVEAFLLAAGNAVYGAIYSPSATGCRVLALAADTGRVLWETPLTGIGSMMHSRYRNQVQMTLADGRLAVFGDEGGGKYIEVLDAATGQPRSHTRIDR
jgi:hypothetical protein